MKCKDFEKREIIRMMTLNGAKYVKLVKKLSDYCKDYNKICEDCKCYLEYMEVRKKHFIFGCEKSEKKIAILPNYHTSKFPDLLIFVTKILKSYGKNHYHLKKNSSAA